MARSHQPQPRRAVNTHLLPNKPPKRTVVVYAFGKRIHTSKAYLPRCECSTTPRYARIASSSRVTAGHKPAGVPHNHHYVKPGTVRPPDLNPGARHVGACVPRKIGGIGLVLCGGGGWCWASGRGSGGLVHGSCIMYQWVLGSISRVVGCGERATRSTFSRWMSGRISRSSTVGSTGSGLVRARRSSCTMWAGRSGWSWGDRWRLSSIGPDGVPGAGDITGGHRSGRGGPGGCESAGDHFFGGGSAGVHDFGPDGGADRPRSDRPSGESSAEGQDQPRPSRTQVGAGRVWDHALLGVRGRQDLTRRAG